MKLRLITAVGLGLLCAQANAAATETTTTQTQAVVAQSPATTVITTTGTSTLTSEQDKLSYAVGMEIGGNFKMQGIDINSVAFSQGVKDALAGAKPLLTPKEMTTVIQNFQKQFMAKQKARLKELSDKNKQEGDAYMAANKAKPGVVVLPNGLQYKIVEAGTGAMPTDNDIVTADYSGTLVNGTEFDSSYKRGKPVKFPLSDVIPGWREALKLMKSGSTWEVVVPPSLAYGERGIPGPIGPNATLVFKIHLIGVEPKAAASNSSSSANKKS